MRFHLRDMTGPGVEAAARHFEENGFFMLDGVGDEVTAHFRPLLAEMMDVSAGELREILDPNSAPMVLPVEIRQRLSRITTPPELRDAIFAALEPVFVRILGPLVHVSSSFHGQFKGGEMKAVDHGGYKQDYLEVQGQYLLHQDFTGANIPTSPCAITLWVAQNSCPDFNLRLYPRSHKVGLICEQWLPLDDPKLAFLGAPIDVVAEEGTAVIFNSLLLHSSSNPGPRRRVSCDIRFFPLCGFLPSEVHVLGARPLATLRRRLTEESGDTLRAPLLEDLAFLGEGEVEPDVPPLSVRNWANYLVELLNGDPDAALPHFERFVNVDHGWDAPQKYTSKYHDRQIHRETLLTARRKIAAAEPGTSFDALDRLVDRVGTRAPAGA
jgi:hypothetical protein